MGKMTSGELSEKAAELRDRYAGRDLPEHCKEGLIGHIMFGRPVGGFLTAMLAGDLFAALRRADSENGRLLHDYGWFLLAEAPHECFGGYGKVAVWQNEGGLVGRNS